MTDAPSDLVRDLADSWRERCDLPADDVAAWCAGMLKKDRVGFICAESLRALQDRFDAPNSR